MASSASSKDRAIRGSSGENRYVSGELLHAGKTDGLHMEQQGEVEASVNSIEASRIQSYGLEIVPFRIVRQACIVASQAERKVAIGSGWLQFDHFSIRLHGFVKLGKAGGEVYIASYKRVFGSG